MTAIFHIAVSKKDFSTDQKKMQFILNTMVYFAFQPVNEMYPVFSSTNQLWLD